ncbi:MAG: hypothetical protein ACK56I_19795, partial [bacterium]
PLRRHSPFTAPLHAAHRRQGGESLYPQTQTLHRPGRAARAAQSSGPPARRHTLPGFPAAGYRGGPPGTEAARRVHFAPELQAEPRREPFSPGRRQGFLHAPPPFQTTPPLGPLATAERRHD